jgi:hypothetical protein
MHDITGRHFQLWDYSPSHSRLLIRSPRRNENDYNLDIIFFGVDHMDIDDVLGEISIHTHSSSDDIHKRFVLRSSKKDHTIEAVNYKIIETFGDYFDSSPLNHMNFTFEPSFTIYVKADLPINEFREWFFKAHASIGIIPATVVLGRLGLNYIEVGNNDIYDPTLANTEDDFLNYLYSIAVYRNQPFPEEKALIREQVALCRHIVHRIEEQNWKYGITGGVEDYL